MLSFFLFYTHNTFSTFFLSFFSDGLGADRLAKFAAFLNVMRRLKLYRAPGEVLALSELYNLLLLFRCSGEKLFAT